MDQSRRITRSIGAVLALLFSAGHLMSPAASAAPAAAPSAASSATTVAIKDPAAAADIPSGSPLASCVNAAVDKGRQTWVCVGGALVAADGEARAGASPDTAADAVQDDAEDEAAEAAADQAAPSAVGDDYDSWCENGSICRRIITDYISETKGNAAYGDSDGVIGTFDQVLRVELNGRSQRMRGTWLWDSGPAVEFRGMRIQCREEQSGPNPNCGSYAPDYNQNGRFTISRSDQKDTGRVINGKPVDDDGDYYAEITGYFVPNGYPRYTLAGLKSSQWNCKRSRSPDCKFP